MKHMDTTIKRIVIYVFGLFFLALGIAFSIQAMLGVSPVSSLAYALSLITGFSVGMMTFLANILYIIVQVILNKSVEVKEYIVQLIVTVMFSFFIDGALIIVGLLPAPEGLVMQLVFLLISLFIVSIGLLGYFSSKFPLMPYDALTYSISKRFKLQFAKAKITSDLTNVTVAALICLIFIHSFGSIGIGTFVAAYFIGKITGMLIKRFQQPLLSWVYKTKNEEVEQKYALKETTTN
ncbi:hypothetical protein D1B33_05655 [Lysinibacillus yapensis]|uniref:YitT family protein n=1 Tax=Ureibacillus yapensis TaxID=2304605 RepID=A0A396SQD5_9BACL|nr:DUF6198 family protein [Lysinibacillus yapensis]RHW38369.1 hypothetical protein D1B33_05655 [Lysinibacillus yapensis]